MPQTAPSINLLYYSRGWWYNLTDRQVLLIYLSGFLIILSSGVLMGLLTGRYFLNDAAIVQATESPPVSLTPTPTTKDFNRAQQRITHASQPPLTLIYKTKLDEVKAEWSSEVLSDLLTTSIWDNQVNVVINHTNLEKEAAQLAKKITRQSQIPLADQTIIAPDRTLDTDTLQRILRDELFTRLRGETPRTVIDLAPLVKETAGTRGEIAVKYIEVDISQQKLYLWENREVVGTKVISTGKEAGWTPVGLHKIKNKAQNAWSPTANVYTPYWMAYSFLDEAQAYVGFHGMPYNNGPEGKRLYRPFDTLGQPVTGGCIQLADSDAIELMNWADVGTAVLIHE